MTNTNLLQAMGCIDHKLIADAAPDVPQKKPANRTWVKWVSIAACFVIVAVIAIPFIKNPGVDNPGEYTAHIFSSYEEFATVVPDMQIIENLSNMDGVDVIIEGAFVDMSIEDSTKVENFAWFDIQAKRGDELVAYIQLKLNDKDSAAVYIKNNSLVAETTINGVQVFYGYDADKGCWDSVLEIDGNYFNIHSYSYNEKCLDEQCFIDFLTVILDNER